MIKCNLTLNEFLLVAQGCERKIKFRRLPTHFQWWSQLILLRSSRLHFAINLRTWYGLLCRYLSHQISPVRGSLKLFARERGVSQNADRATLLIRDEIQGIFVCKSTRLWISIPLQPAFRCLKQISELLSSSQCTSRYNVFLPFYIARNEFLIKENLRECWGSDKTML